MPSLTDLANPTRFLAFSARLLPWLWVRRRSCSRSASTSRLRLSGGLPAGRQRAHHAHPRALGDARHGLLHGSWRSPRSGPSSGVIRSPTSRQDGGAARRRLHFPRPRHRLDLGQADVGRLLGVGCAAHVVPRSLHHVSRADRALARLRRSGAGRAGRRRSDPRRLQSTFRSSSFRSTGGTRCIRAKASFAGRPDIDPSMLWPLFIMLAAFTFLFAALHLAAMRAEIFRRRVRAADLWLRAR